MSGVAGRQFSAGDGGRDFDLGRSEYSVHLCSEWREAFPRRGQGHRGPRVSERMEGRKPRDLMRRDIAWTGDRERRYASETSHFRFGLGASEIVERASRLLGGAELSAKISLYLR